MDEEQAVKAAALCAILGNPVRLSLVRAMLLQDTRSPGFHPSPGLASLRRRNTLHACVPQAWSRRGVMPKQSIIVVRQRLSGIYSERWTRRLGWVRIIETSRLERVPLYEPAASPGSSRTCILPNGR